MPNPSAAPGAGGWGAARAGHAPAATLFGRDLPPGRSSTVLVPSRPAIVLGSAQRLSPGPVGHPLLGLPDADVRAPDGVDVVRRRSGGGAVWLDPAEVVWIDVVVPAGDSLWNADVGTAFWWVGVVWAEALRSLGVAHVEVHRGPLVRTAWSAEVCFAGLGAGEVLVDGRKTIGISQRRTRTSALFQCACLLRWDPGPLVAALGLPASAAFELAGAATAVGHGLGAADVEAAFMATLARLHP